jgi:hypothetical protein
MYFVLWRIKAYSKIYFLVSVTLLSRDKKERGSEDINVNG